jgi:hypothetical protein
MRDSGRRESGREFGLGAGRLRIVQGRGAGLAADALARA